MHGRRRKESKKEFLHKNNKNNNGVSLTEYSDISLGFLWTLRVKSLVSCVEKRLTQKTFFRYTCDGVYSVSYPLSMPFLGILNLVYYKGEYNAKDRHIVALRRSPPRRSQRDRLRAYRKDLESRSRPNQDARSSSPGTRTSRGGSWRQCRLTTPQDLRKSRPVPCCMGLHHLYTPHLTGFSQSCKIVSIVFLWRLCYGRQLCIF